MVKHSGKVSPESPLGRQPSFYGVLMVDTVRGSIRVRKWPRPRGENRPAIQKFWSDWLRQVMLLYKYAPSREKIIWAEAVRNMPVKITDLYMQTMRGTLWVLEGPDGTVIYPEVLREKVASSLDSIIQLPGGMLVRGETLWQGIEPAGSSGLVLFTDDTVIPKWGTPVEAGVGRAPIGAYGRFTTQINIPTNTPVVLGWENPQQDPSDPPIWTPDHTTRFYAPVDGWYSMTIYTLWGSVNNPSPHTYLFSSLTDNKMAEVENIISGVHQIGQTASANIRLSAGDYCFAQVLQSSGVTVSLIGTYLSFVLLG